MENEKNIRLFKVVIEEINSYEETVTAFRDPENPDKIYYSKYDVEEDIRKNLLSHQRPTGKMLNENKQIFEQTIEDINLLSVIKAINGIY